MNRSSNLLLLQRNMSCLKNQLVKSRKRERKSSGSYFYFEAANLEDAKEIVKMSQEAKTVVAVSENWSYHPLAFAVANYVQSGGIGEVKH